MRFRFLQRFLAAVLMLASSEAARLELTIEPVFQGEALRLDSLTYSNSAGETLSITRLGYLLSGFALEREDGTWQEFPGTHAWLDAASRRQVIQLPDAPDAR